MMLKEKSTHWARLKLLLFAPLAVVLLQAFAHPETVRTQESLIDSKEKLSQADYSCVQTQESLIDNEGTTISQQSKQWTKDYFDKKVDAYVQKVNGNTNDCKKWPWINVRIDNEIYGIELMPTEESTRLFVRYENFSKSDEELKKMINILTDHLIDIEMKRYEKNLHSPSIVCLTVENTSDSDVQSLLNALGELNEEFTKARKEQIQNAKKSTVKTAFTEMYSDVPVFVTINERIKLFPNFTLNIQSSGQQKAESISQNDTLFKKESYRKANEMIIKEDTDSIKKFILNGTAIIMLGDQKMTLNGDSIEINLEPVRLIDGKMYSFDLKQLEEFSKQKEEEFSKQMEEFSKQKEKEFSKYAEEFKKQKEEFRKHGEELRKQVEEFRKQKLEEFRKQAEEFSKQVEEFRKSKLKKTEESK